MLNIHSVNGLRGIYTPFLNSTSINTTNLNVHNTIYGYKDYTPIPGDASYKSLWLTAYDPTVGLNTTIKVSANGLVNITNSAGLTTLTVDQVNTANINGIVNLYATGEIDANNLVIVTDTMTDTITSYSTLDTWNVNELCTSTNGLCATTGFTYPNYFDQGLNTTSNVSFNSMNSTNGNITIGYIQNLTTNGTFASYIKMNGSSNGIDSIFNITENHVTKVQPHTMVNMEYSANWNNFGTTASPLKLANLRFTDARHLGIGSIIDYMRVMDFGFNRNASFQSDGTITFYSIIMYYELNDAGN